MRHIGEQLKEYKKSYPEKEQQLWLSINRMGEALEGIETGIVDELRRAIHEDFCGPHYNEHFAKEDVAAMFNKDDKGVKVIGELVGMTKATEVFGVHKQRIAGDKYNVYDMYVALNASMHDMGELFAKWSEEKAHDMVVQYAVDFWFADDDAPDGKIWLYMKAI